MSRPPRSGGGRGAADQAARPKRRAAATHFFKYQLASNPSRAEENDLRRALQESLEEQQHHHKQAAPHHRQQQQQHKQHATNNKKTPATRLVSSTNSSDVSRSNNSSSTSNESNAAVRPPPPQPAPARPLKRNRTSQPTEHEQPSNKRTKQTLATNLNGHSSATNHLLLCDGSVVRVHPTQTVARSGAPQPAPPTRTPNNSLPPNNSITSYGKATQTMPAAECSRAIRTYSRSEPQLIRTSQKQQFNVINDLIVVRSSTPKASHPAGLPLAATTAILVSPMPQPQSSKQHPLPVQPDCSKLTKNTNKSSNNHHLTSSTNQLASTNQPTLPTPASGATTNNNHRKQTRTSQQHQHHHQQQQQVSQSAKSSSEQRSELDLHNNESNARTSKVARCLIFNTMDLSLKAATFEPQQTQHRASSKLNDTSTTGTDGAGKLPQGSWSLLGVPEEKVIYLKDDEPPKRLICYPAIKHVEGDVIQVKDSVLLRSGARKTDLPYIAKVCSFWKNSETGGVMMSLLWYYRPEHTEEGRKPHNLPDEIFASRHRDVDSVECIEDKCYVLTFNEYCRYRKRCKMEQLNTTWSLADVTIPVSNESYPRRTRIPDYDVSSELVFCCRQIYDSRTKRLIKNPLISPKYGNI